MVIVDADDGLSSVQHVSICCHDDKDMQVPSLRSALKQTLFQRSNPPLGTTGRVRAAADQQFIAAAGPLIPYVLKDKAASALTKLPDFLLEGAVM